MSEASTTTTDSSVLDSASVSSDILTSLPTPTTTTDTATSSSTSTTLSTTTSITSTTSFETPTTTSLPLDSTTSTLIEDIPTTVTSIVSIPTIVPSSAPPQEPTAFPTQPSPTNPPSNGNTPVIPPVGPPSQPTVPDTTSSSGSSSGSSVLNFPSSSSAPITSSASTNRPAAISADVSSGVTEIKSSSNENTNSSPGNGAAINNNNNIPEFAGPTNNNSIDANAANQQNSTIVAVGASIAAVLFVVVATLLFVKARRRHSRTSKQDVLKDGPSRPTFSAFISKKNTRVANASPPIEKSLPDPSQQHHVVYMGQSPPPLQPMVFSGIATLDKMSRSTPDRFELDATKRFSAESSVPSYSSSLSEHQAIHLDQPLSPSPLSPSVPIQLPFMAASDAPTSDIQHRYSAQSSTFSQDTFAKDMEKALDNISVKEVAIEESVVPSLTMASKTDSVTSHSTASTMDPFKSSLKIATPSVTIKKLNDMPTPDSPSLTALPFSNSKHLTYVSMWSTNSEFQ